ncbi:MAG: LamG-like jellyroll fold domain-containing protein [Myxococcota bacterium]
MSTVHRPSSLGYVAVWLVAVTYLVGCTQFEPAPSSEGDGSADDAADTVEAPTDVDAAPPTNVGDITSTDDDVSESNGDTPSVGDAPDSSPDISEFDDVTPPEPDVEGDAPATTDAADTAEMDGESDAGPTAEDTEDGDSTEEVVNPPCVDLCPGEGIFRCMDGVIPATERCTTDVQTGCLFWDPFQVCTDNACQGQAICDNGACDHDGQAGLTCTSSDPCMASVCDPESEGCVDTPLPGGGCDDGEACTSLDTCSADGACVGTPDASLCPCSNDSDCLAQDPDGEACEDRYLCQPISPESQASACVYSDAPTICPSEPLSCTTSACVPETGLCSALPVAVEVACDDGDPCTKNEQCDGAGVCVGFPDAVNCSCATDTDCLGFDEDGDACNGRYVCTDLNWAAGAMACVYEPTPVTCPEPDSECLTAGCAPATGECVDLPVPDGQPCDDANLCSASSSCLFGLCSGSDYVNCADGKACDNMACDADTGTCYVESINIACCGNGILEEGEACDTAASWCTKTCEETSCVQGSLAVGLGCMQFPTGQGALGATFTLDFFIRVVGSEGTVLASGQGVNAPWRLALEPRDSGPTLVWYESVISLNGKDSVTGPVLTEGQWHHVTMTRDGTAPAYAQTTFWLDAVPYGGGALTAFPFAHADWGWIGCQGSGAPPMPALIDELRWREGLHPPDGIPTEPHASAGTLLLYHFDDVTPGVAVDASGWNRHGAWQGCSRADETPFEGQAGTCEATWCDRSALLFNPNQEAVGTIPPSPAMAGVSSLTVEFYLRLDDTSEPQMVISQSTGAIGGPDWHILAVSGGGALGRLQWHEGQEAGEALQLDNFITSGLLTGGVTHHVAFVRSVGADGSVTGRWHINGEAGTLTTLESAMPLELTTRPIYLGSQAGSTLFLDGFIDELRISSAAMYDDAPFTPGVIVETPQTLGLYRFDIGAGNWAYPELWGTLPPMLLEGITYASAGATAVGPCP